MCGITGFWTLYQTSNKTALNQMMDTIHHRGPDGRGSFSNGHINMGHTRLSIIDLETGHQPLYGDPSKKLVYTGNAEFYDYKRIRCQLTAEGFDFDTKSDNELALKLYQKHGLEFVDHLRGEFAFAVFDEHMQRLILVRDRFGIRPLFYRIEKDALFWGSEIKAIAAHPDINLEVDYKAALHQMMQTMVPGMSLFKGVQALKPGHMLIIDKKDDRFEITEKKYWDCDFPQKDDHQNISEKQATEELRQRLIESIHLRLEADVPVACYLSGGIDSCSIYGLASALQQSPVSAFTIGFEHKDYDETQIAQSMTSHEGAEHHIITLGAEHLYGENFEKSAWFSERTFYNTLGVAKYLLSRKVNETGLKVVITGEGSDELFAGYPFFKQDLVKVGGFADLLGENFDLYKKGSNSLFKGAIMTDDHLSHPAFQDVCGFTPSWLQNWMETLRVAEGLLSEEAKEELKDYDPIAAIAESLDKSQIDGRHPLNKAQYTWIKTMLEGQILNWGGDRVDMAHSLETRPAFLDHKLAEFAFHLPPQLLIKNGVEKYILREAVKGVLPEVLYKREKFPFMAPPAHFDDNKIKALKKLCDDHLQDQNVKHLGVFDQKKTSDVVKQYFDAKDPVKATRLDALMNHILTLHILDQQFHKKG